MIEVVGGIAMHLDLLHHPPRLEVGRHGERHDLVEPELLEAEAQRGARGLRRVAAAPVLASQPPTDLDAGREVRLEARDRKPDEAEEVGGAGRLDRPQSEAMAREVVSDALPPTRRSRRA